MDAQATSLWARWESALDAEMDVINGRLAQDMFVVAQVPGTISPGPFQQFNCIINTVVSLLGATVVTFIASAFVGGKFDMVGHAPSLLKYMSSGCQYSVALSPCLLPAVLSTCHRRRDLYHSGDRRDICLLDW